MKQFVSCVKIEDENTENILLSLDAVRSIRRYYRAERGDVVEDYNGNFYGCYKPVFEDGVEVGYDEDFERCIITVGDAI